MEVMKQISSHSPRRLALLGALLCLHGLGCGGDGDSEMSPGVDGGTDDASMTDDAGDPDAEIVNPGYEPPCQAPQLPPLDREAFFPEGTFNDPVFLTGAPGTGALFVVEQRGVIKKVEGGNISVFLDIETAVRSGGERGLLGLAFHPEYASNGRFFVYYTPKAPDTNRLAEYNRSSVGQGAAGEVAVLVDINDPEDNHNGGMIAFGPDGYLYAGTGDGGGGGDGTYGGSDHGPIGHGQSLDVLMGKILRLDVDNGPSYAAAGNPFAGGGGLPQIWSYGLRNPWRFSFDRKNGDIYVGDVGQSAWEEIDIQPGTSSGGENYGWRAYEGDHVFDGDLTIANHTPPALEVAQDDGSALLAAACSITGGYVYRGGAIPELRGIYLFGDYCSPNVAALQYCNGAVQGSTRVPDLLGGEGGLVSFGQDNAGELYLIYRDSDRIMKIVPQ